MASGIREAFIARPGTVFAGADYASLELCTLAQTCLDIWGKSRMAEAINAGMDINTLLGAQMADMPYEEMVKRLKAGDNRAKGLRQAAKTANYGFGGGLGAATLAVNGREAGLSLCVSMGRATTCGEYKVTEFKHREIPPTCLECIASAEFLKKEWLEAWPEMRDYLAMASKVEENGGEVVQPRSKRVRGACTYTSAANNLFQGGAADGAKRALWLVSKECHVDVKSPLWNSRPVIFLHDEIIMESPEEGAHEALMRLKELMVAGMREYTPDVQIRTEGALMRRWYKSAETVVVNGRVVPSKPENRGETTVWVHDERAQ